VNSETALLDCRDDNLEEGGQCYARAVSSVRDASKFATRCSQAKSAARRPLFTVADLRVLSGPLSRTNVLRVVVIFAETNKVSFFLPSPESIYSANASASVRMKERMQESRSYAGA